MGLLEGRGDVREALDQLVLVLDLAALVLGVLLDAVDLERVIVSASCFFELFDDGGVEIKRTRRPGRRRRRPCR